MTGVLGSWRGLLARERTRILTEVIQVRGLMPFLMKPRNGRDAPAGLVAGSPAAVA